MGRSASATAADKGCSSWIPVHRRPRVSSTMLCSQQLLQLRRLLMMMHLVWALLLSLEGRGATARDYCLDEIVEMQCGTGEILIVESAKFGRMQLNRCVKTDYGYIGCGSDVTDILAGKCSGRRHCRIFNLEVLFSGTKVCPQDLKSYLEAKFRCAKVVLPVQTISCLQGGPLTVQSTRFSSSGLIASITSYEHGVGDSGCPWVIEAFPGQRINLTLMDFTDYGGSGGGGLPSSSSAIEQHSPDHVDHSRRVCRELAVVEETTALKNLVTCSHQPRSNIVFVSKANRVKITFSARNLDEDQPPHFVLKYDVYGCVYPSVLPSKTHLVLPSTDGGSGSGGSGGVDDDSSVIRVQCNHSDEFWMLRCDHRNGTWKGSMGNCTLVPSTETPTFNRFSYGMSLLLVLVVAVSICFIFLASGLLCLYRSKRLRRQQSRTKLGIVASMSSYSSSRSLDPSSKSSTTPRCLQTPSSGGGRAIYCPLDTKCTTLLHPIDDQPVSSSTSSVFHTLMQEPNFCRRTIPLSTPLPRGVTAQHLQFLQRPSCTCGAVRATASLMSCNAGQQTRPAAATGGGDRGGGQQQQLHQSKTLIMDDDCTPAAVTFTTFKPVSPANEYGTPTKQPRLNRGGCPHIMEPPICCAGTPQVTRRALQTTTMTGVERRPDVCGHEPSTVEENLTI